jgi:hypothetical protein
MIEVMCLPPLLLIVNWSFVDHSEIKKIQDQLYLYFLISNMYMKQKHKIEFSPGDMCAQSALKTL